MAFWKKSSSRSEPSYETYYDPESMSYVMTGGGETHRLSEKQMAKADLYPSSVSVGSSYTWEENEAARRWYEDAKKSEATTIAYLTETNKRLKKDNEDLLATVETLTKQIKEMDRE